MFLLRSIHQLRPALESLQDGKYEEVDKTDAKFKTMIPSPLTFEIIEQIVPMMEKACQLSEMLSADGKPTIQQVLNTYIFVIYVKYVHFIFFYRKFR